jgi:mono/diheme cytochrome c family protein
MSRLRRLALPLAVSIAAPALAAEPDGAKLYARCAACHLPTGAGVPGTYPPLGADFRARAASPAGRRFLALAVVKGLMGPLIVEGKTYRGVMPAQALNDAEAAAVLNHVGGRVAMAGPSFRPFTAAEIKAARASGEGLNAAAVAKLAGSAK